MIKAQSAVIDSPDEAFYVAQQNADIKEKLQSIKQDRKLKGKYPKIVIWVVIVYLAFAGSVMLNPTYLHISDSVMMVFLGTTVVNTVSLLHGVIKYLFTE